MPTLPKHPHPEVDAIVNAEIAELGSLYSEDELNLGTTTAILGILVAEQGENPRIKRLVELSTELIAQRCVLRNVDLNRVLEVAQRTSRFRDRAAALTTECLEKAAAKIAADAIKKASAT